MNIHSIFAKHTAAVAQASKALDYARDRRQQETSAAAKAAMSQAGLSLRETARRIGVSAPHLSDVLRGNRQWNESILDKFSKGFATTKPRRK